jgi:mono/diheme cytochrome c family protein
VSGVRDWATRSRLRIALLTLLGAFLLIQLVPYGHDHSNPPVTKALVFDSPRTEELFTGACGDCHSNLTSWPAESNVAPFSWLIQHDVDEGRGILDVSEWDRPQPDIGELSEVIGEGEMPPLQYKLLHPGARLSDSEKADLVAGLTRSYQSDPPGGH